jgi:hypothetical protein
MAYSIPTPSESQLLTDYHDELLPCYNRTVAAAYKVAPALEPVLTQERSDLEAAQLLLIKRQVTWGEAAQRERQILEGAKEKLRTVRV